MALKQLNPSWVIEWWIPGLEGGDGEWVGEILVGGIGPIMYNRSAVNVCTCKNCKGIKLSVFSP